MPGGVQSTQATTGSMHMEGMMKPWPRGGGGGMYGNIDLPFFQSFPQFVAVADEKGKARLLYR